MLPLLCQLLLKSQGLLPLRHPASPLGVAASLHTPSSAKCSISWAATAPAAGLSSPLPLLPPGMSIVLPTKQAIANHLHLEVGPEPQAGKEVKETPTKGVSHANVNVLVLRCHLLQLKDSIAELSTAVNNSNHLILVSNTPLKKLQAAVDAHAKAPPSSVFPIIGLEGELQGLKTALEGTNFQVDILAHDLTNLFNIMDAEFKKVWPAVRSITADVRQSVEAQGKLDMKLRRILTDLGNLKVSVERSVWKLNSNVSSVVAAQIPVVPLSFSFTSPFPPVSGSSTTPLSSSLGKRGFNAFSGGESRAALIMSPVILPID